MGATPHLPLPVEELPERVRRFGDPSAPTPARTMAAKGLVPVKGADLVTLLAQLAHDNDPTIASSAAKTLEGLPDNVLHNAAAEALHSAVLSDLAKRFLSDEALLERLVQNNALPDDALAAIAERCSERLGEVVATNQQRLLGAPAIIEDLYKNPAVRMSTADRLVELAARNDVELSGIPAFSAHVQAIQNQLIPEPTEEPLPSDASFQEALQHDDDDPEAIERDTMDGSEEVKEKFVPLGFRIRQMGLSEKIRLAMVGDAAARSLLVRDPNKMVSFAAISSPRMSEREAVAIAHSREVSEEVLRYIANRRDWLRSYEMKRALVFNAKAPVAIALQFVSHLRENDLRSLARSRNVPAAVKTVARQRMEKKQKR